MAEPRKKAIDVAARALARRDRTEADVREILASKGVSDADCENAVATLRRAGALDDERFARRSAEALAGRGFGDAAIVFRLEREGVDHELAAEAVARLQPEAERAVPLAARRGACARAARWLSARGFSADSVEHALPSIARSEATELG